ncbi:glycosyltransferase [Pseudoalteromonas sp. TB13]|uniref:glycosyltransferase n=1 Tax=Pseudoalteromonas sp. NZS100_1 TaxID=2792073 RepID=UPI00272DCE6C|nr:glycosyltransferase [Pseudoalteromonas sp. TB13]
MIYGSKIQGCNALIKKCFEKKITLFISSLAGGGAEGVCVTVASGLAEAGWDVTLVILTLKDAAYRTRLSKKVNLVVLDLPNARSSILPIYNYLKTHKPTKVVVFNYELSLILLLIKLFMRVNVKIISRNINSLSENSKSVKRSFRTSVFSFLLMKIYKRSDHIVNQCEGMRTDLLSVFPKLKNKTSVIYNPVNTTVENEAVNIKPSEVFKGDYILCVGRLEDQKAFHFAIQAFSVLSKNHPSLRLKIVGQGSLEQKLKQLVSDFNLSEKVDFEGFQQSVIPYYLHAKLTLLTSLYEGFPNTLVESISLGTPVVAFNCKSGPSEIIEQGKNGYLVEYQNINSLQDYLDKALKSPFNGDDVLKSSEIYKIKNIIQSWEALLNEY